MMLLIAAILASLLHGRTNELSPRSNVDSRTLDPSFCQTLFDADTNGLRYQTDYDVNIQNKTDMRMSNDEAPEPLFSWVNETRLKRSTYTLMEDLFDNYFLYTGQTEQVSRKEMSENKKFTDAVMATAPMEIAHRYLVEERLAPKSMKAFKVQLLKMWFYFYGRKAYRDSSGFEHVFVGEIASKRRGRQSVGGLHNWVRFYREERGGFADYEGHIKVTSIEPRLLTIRFKLDGVEKPIGGFFVGTSPEFELALYTVCFLKLPNGACTCPMNGRNVKIMTYRKNPNMVNTAYPVA